MLSGWFEPQLIAPAPNSYYTAAAAARLAAAFLGEVGSDSTAVSISSINARMRSHNPLFGFGDLPLDYLHAIRLESAL
jgi:hypothetical protein